MGERCRCGAGLVAELAFCVACGARRPAPRVLVGAGAGGTQPVPVRTVVPARPALPTPPMVPTRPVADAWPVAGAWPVAAPSRPVDTSSWGHPTHHAAAPRSAGPWVVAVASLAVVAVVGVVLLLALRPAAVTAQPAVQPAAQPTVVAGPTTTVTAVPTSATGSSAGQTLDAQVAADRDAVEGLTGQWVPQLSSKRVGMVADGITYDADAILEHYRGLVGAHPDAKLLWSGDWPVFNAANYWVVVVDRPFTTAAAANAWCSAQGFGPDDCLAKKLSHTGGPQGTTVPRS